MWYWSELRIDNKSTKQQNQSISNQIVNKVAEAKRRFSVHVNEITMACEYHLSSRSSYLVKNAYGPNGSALCAPRTGSYRKPKELPIIQVKCNTNNGHNHNNVDNNNVSSNIMKVLQETRSKPASVPQSPSTLGSNKSYYSSTRSFSSKCAGNGNANGHNTVSTISTFMRNSKTTSSSGNSSVESIAPKYIGINGNGPMDGGSKKRAYQTVKVAKKQIPQNVPNTKTYSAAHATHHHSKNSNKKQMTTHENNTINRPNGASSFSTKFPNGLPFEEEFYRSRKRNSVKSENSDFSTAYESDQCPLPFEEEFSRRKSSTEPLYVDFSKKLPAKGPQQPTNKNDFFDKFDKASNFVCNPNEVIVQDQPVVHVAVTWWAPECQHFGSEMGGQSASTYTDLVWVKQYNFIKLYLI